MDLRNSPRRQVELNTTLNYRSLGLVQGRIRDIGMGGMFVDIGRIQLPVNAVLEVSLMIESAKMVVPMTVEAMVVRCAEKGVGLMFDELDGEVHKALTQLVFGSSDTIGDKGGSLFLH